MLVLKIHGLVTELRWPGGHWLLLYGPTPQRSGLLVTTPDGSEQHGHPWPRPGEEVRIACGGLSFGVVGSLSRTDRIGLRIGPECEVVRRPRQRHAS